MTPLWNSIISKCVSKKMTNIYIARSSRQVNSSSRLDIVVDVVETTHKTFMSACLAGAFFYILFILSVHICLNLFVIVFLFMRKKSLLLATRLYYNSK